MQQQTAFIYTVAPNETVTIDVTAVKVNPAFVLASTEGRTLQNVNPGGNPRFTCPIDVESGQVQIAIVLCSFPFDTPDDAECDFSLSGSAGGGQFRGPTVAKIDQIHAVNLNFIVQ